MAVEPPHAGSSMAFGPPLAASSATFFYAVCKDFFVYVKRKSRRVKDLLKDFAELKREVDDLEAHWKDINEEIERQSWSIQKNKRFEALNIKFSWCCKYFEKIEEKYTMYCGGNQSETNVDQEIIDQEQKIWTRNFFELAKLDKDIFKLLPKIISVRNELQVEKLTCHSKPKFVKRMEADELVDIVPSHKKHFEVLKEYLCRENCKRIGIYGAPGVGITNIMKNLNNCFDPSSPPDCKLDLDYVIWVTVPWEPTKEKMIESIQEKIMQRLNIDWQKNKSWNAADIISTALSKKKYLLLLDEFSLSIGLEEIGIPEHKDGKVVIAAKHPHAMSKVKLDEYLEVDKLSLEDSRKLFNKVVGIDTLSVEQKDMVDPILKELDGLPEVIRPIAEYLKENRGEEDVWNGIKQRLKSKVSSTYLLKLGGLEKAYMWLYEKLEEDSFKKCLLYAALFPNEIPRSTLVEYWKAEQFLSCTWPTMKAARGEGAIVIEHLKKSCLLQICCAEYVKLSGIFRKIIFKHSHLEDEDGESFRSCYIEGEDGKSIVKSGPEIDGHVQKKEWKIARRVSMIQSKLKELPQSPECDHISTLLLQLNPDLRIIQSLFFKTMKTLRVLDLHTTGIKSLPHSISFLTALRCLYLNNCSKLEKLPPEIVKLKKLEVLDIQGTKIPCLPKEISSLINLRCLRISFVPEECNPKMGTRVIFPPGIANKLQKLEELTIASKRTGISEEIFNRIKKEVSEFKDKINVSIEGPCIQRKFQGGKGTDPLSPSCPKNPVQDPMTQIQSPSSGNKGPSYPQSGSTHGRTYSNYQASKKGKEKIVENPKSKKTAIGGVLKIRGSPETNACQINSQGDDFPGQQTERASGGDVDRPCSSTGASTSGTAGRAD